MNHFCTYCDRNYAARLLCLHDSLLGQGEPFRLYVLCFDAETEAVVQAAGRPGLVPVGLAEVLQADPDFAAVRGSRSPVEFYFTATPVVVRHCLLREPAAGRMTYLDADLCFFGPVSAIFAEQGDASVGIVPHRFPARLAGLRKTGTYNVAWVSFRRDPDGLACLEWWRARCLEWCRDCFDGGRYADQGYLNEFPDRFGGVRALDHAGINAAPWNMDGVRVSLADGSVRVNDRPLLFYHFQGIRELLPGWFEPGLLNYQTTLTAPLRDLVYLPYLEKLVAAEQRLKLEHGIVPRLGYQRLPDGNSWRDRRGRLVARWLLPYYRRLRGQLLRCPAPGAPRSSREA
jgi:hypothetical protein